MSLFNEKHIKAMLTGEYFCPNCNGLMEFEDEWKETLVCPRCGYDLDVDKYGFDSDEEYEAMFPTLEEILDDEE